MCSTCNASIGNRFDTNGKKLDVKNIAAATEVLQADSPMLLSERALLLHPEIDSPENHIYFDSEGSAVGRTTRGRYTIDVCRLNRSDLVTARMKVIDSIYRELFELYFNFVSGRLKVRGQLFKKEIPEDFEQFFRRLYERQQANNEFSRLYQSIWENLPFYETALSNDETFNNRFRNQISIC